MSDFFPCLDIEDYEYHKALGNREFFIYDELYLAFEDSDLGVCCSGISDVRNILLKCKIFNGLCKEDIDRIKEIGKNHNFFDVIFMEEKRPCLFKILKSLGIYD